VRPKSGEARIQCLFDVLLYWLRQLRRVRRSLDAESVLTLVHAFVMSRVDYCNAVLAGAPGYIIDKLQRLLNAAARLVTGTRKFDRGLEHLLHMTTCTGSIFPNEFSSSSV